jgi:hypothetical protein
MNPITVALVYAVVGFLGMPIGFKLFKTPFDWIDIALASVGGALAHTTPSWLAYPARPSMAGRSAGSTRLPISSKIASGLTQRSVAPSPMSLSSPSFIGVSAKKR